MTAVQRKACAEAKKVINDLLKHQQKMSAADAAKIMGPVYDITDAAKKVTWP